MLSWLFMLPAQAIAESEPLQKHFVRDFSNFAGSDANAQSLYAGLKHGTRITLAAPSTTTSGGGIATPVVQFDPPTRPMGNGNVFICAALAKQQLTNYGITEPTLQQLQAALTSGTIRPPGSMKPVVLKGILVQRADGMGWGSIAKNAGAKLGKAGHGFKPGNTVIAGAAKAQTGGGMNMRPAGRGNSAHAPLAVVVSATDSAFSAGFNTQDQAGGLAGRPGRLSTGQQVQGKGLIKQ